jgi:hypothetical protein
MPISESTIIAKSIDFFNDPEPCFIHRSAVMMRIYLEIEEYIKETGNESICLEEIPKGMQDYFRGVP